MKKEKPKFNALTPEVLEEGNKFIYNEALDFAFDNKDIKNIAITGIYGSGKSTVWNTYVNKSDKLRNKNIITVSLGKYEDNIEEIKIKSETNENKDNNSDTKDKDIEANNKDTEANNKGTEYDKIRENILDNENRVERQIINQILSQINPKDIPLSKYGFKSNKSCCTILFETLAMFGIVSSVLLWINIGSIVDKTGFSYICVLISCIIMLFLSFLYIFYRYFRENIFRISKIKFRGAEADVGYNEKNDETVLDRDIKELVYLIKSSNSKIIVFDDLDRYDNIAIYTKLRELNFLLNKYSKTNENENKNENESIKFVYMLRDGIFKSKNRTKFFDYIIPIVPIVDSKNSESMMLNLLGDLKSLIDNRLIFNISLYIDDMRLIKNIINEFIIYKDIINMKDLELSYDKLFSLIALKNIFPYEFDMLQEDKGCLFYIINEIEQLKNKQRIILKEKNENIQIEIDLIDTYDVTKEEINSINDLIEKEILELKLVKPSIESFEKEILIRKINDNEYIEFLGEDTFNKICNLLIDLNVNKKFINLDKELLSLVPPEKIDSIMSNIRNYITNKNNFPIIRFLILQGYIDKTYWHYKGYFYKESLGVNDVIFIKKINEAQVQDPFLELENPSEIINRLDTMDFSKFNILNKKLLECCINENRIEYILSIARTVFENKEYIKLSEILESYDYNIIEKFIFILLPKYKNEIEKLLDVFKDCHCKAYINILIAIYSNNNLDIDIIENFNSYIEKNWEIVQFVSEEKYPKFLKNMKDSEVGFLNLSGEIVENKRFDDIIKSSAYLLHVKNSKYILERMLGMSVQYGNLLSEIYNSSLLECKNYIDNNFDCFLQDYVNKNENKEEFINEENILIKILNSEISNEFKMDYLNLNNTKLTNINDFNNAFKNEDLLNCMFNRDIILFNKDNVKIYYDNIQKSSKEFIDYLERNLNQLNVDEILQGNPGMCNEFINNPELRDGLFEYIYKYANEPIETLDSDLSKERIELLLEKELIEINYKNINFLLEKNWEEVIIMWVTSTENDIQDEFVDILLDCELEEKEDLIYDLVNSKISDENAMKLVDLIESGVLIEKINSDKKNLISSIIDRELSNDNINYVCNIFKEFALKEKFIDNLVNDYKLSSLSNDNLNDDVMTFILKLKDLDVDIKIDLICKKIDNNTDISLLRKYIETVEEISKLAEVWDNKIRKLETYEEQKVGNKLLEKGIVKRYGEGYPIKIFISKDKKR